MMVLVVLLFIAVFYHDGDRCVTVPGCVCHCSMPVVLLFREVFVTVVPVVLLFMELLVTVVLVVWLFIEVIVTVVLQYCSCVAVCVCQVVVSNIVLLILFSKNY